MLYLFLLSYSISSKHVFIAVSDFGVPKKKLNPDNSQAKVKYPPLGTENSQMPRVSRGKEGGGGGTLKFRFDLRIISTESTFYLTCTIFVCFCFSPFLISCFFFAIYIFV